MQIQEVLLVAIFLISILHNFVCIFHIPPLQLDNDSLSSSFFGVIFGLIQHPIHFDQVIYSIYSAKFLFCFKLLPPLMFFYLQLSPIFLVLHYYDRLRLLMNSELPPLLMLMMTIIPLFNSLELNLQFPIDSFNWLAHSSNKLSKFNQSVFDKC